MSGVQRFVALAHVAAWGRMIRLANPWLILALLGALGGAWGHGYWTGIKTATARHNDALLEQIKEGEELDAERRKIAAERDDLARQLEEAAYADPVVVDRCLGSGRVQRLNAIR